MPPHPVTQLFLWFFRSSRIGTFRQVPIEAHHSLILVFLLFVGNFPALLFIASLYFCILLHEIGHLSVIQWFGFPVDKIALSPLGGWTKLTNMQTILHFAQKPKKEMLMSFAGPLTNLVLAAVFGILNFFFPSWFFYGLTLVNLLLGGFNLLPAFPMDGGRFLRAFLYHRGTSYYTATERAIFVGSYVYIGLAILGLYQGNFFVIILALFLYFISKAELIRALQIESMLHPQPNLSPFGATVSPEQMFMQNLYRNFF